MSKQALPPLLNDHERLGSLERRQSPDDGRGRVIWLTDRGLAFAGAIKRVTTGIEREWSERLGQDRYAIVRAALVDLAGESS